MARPTPASTAGSDQPRRPASLSAAVSSATAATTAHCAGQSRARSARRGERARCRSVRARSAPRRALPPAGPQPGRGRAGVNTATPEQKIRRLPSRSPSAPPVSRNPAKTRVYPSVIHWMPVSEADSSRPITGTATLMTVTSRITMKYPAHTASSGAQDCPSGCGADSGEGMGSPPPADCANATAPTPSRPRRRYTKRHINGHMPRVAGVRLLIRTWCWIRAMAGRLRAATSRRIAQ